MIFCYSFRLYYQYTMVLNIGSPIFPYKVSKLEPRHGVWQPNEVPLLVDALPR
jgi:hypothetical protein